MMNYQELIAKALNGRSVNSMAKLWGVPQVTLNRYVTGKHLPDYDTGIKIAKEAGIDLGEAFEVLAREAQVHKSKQFKLQSGFVQTQLAALLAVAAITTSLYIM